MGAALPRLNETKQSQDLTATWYGYDHNLTVRDGSFRDMQNLTGDLYPLSTVRKGRGRVRALENAHGLFALNGLAWVDGQTLYYNGTAVDGLTLTDDDKTFVGMGAYICIFPDKVMFNTADGTYRYMDAENTVDGIQVRLTRVDGLDYDNIIVSDTEPPENQRVNGTFWLDTSGGEQVLRVYSELFSAWQSVPSSYIRIAGDGISDNILDMDTVKLTETPAAGQDPHEFLNGSYTVYATGTTTDGIPYIVIPGIWHNGTSVYEDMAVTLKVERKMPQMDYICEHENRLYGCSSANHEIYCSKLGDPTNWSQFLGVSTDSYAATVGSPGDFTGCKAHGGYVLFFKADRIHKLYGAYPSKFQLTDVSCRGVESGSSNSLVSVNEVLLYKSEHDVCAYTSATPQEISEALGKNKYRDAWAGAYNGKYYLSMVDTETCKPIFLAYETDKGLWYREDDTQARYFANDGKDLYFLDGNIIRSVNGTLDAAYTDEEAAIEDIVEWYGETGDIGMGRSYNSSIAKYANAKFISKLQFRLEVEEGSVFRIELSYDGQDQWEEKYRINGTRKRTILVNIVPRRCDTMRIRISGYGPFKLYSLTKTFEIGAEV